MYKLFIKPILFLISPERVHYLVSGILSIICKIPLIAPLLKVLFTYNNPDLEREIAGIKFKNPVGLAAGFDKNATLYSNFSNFGFGYIEIGTVTPRPQDGNIKPRLFRLTKDKALINRMGFNNNGLSEAIKMLDRKHNITIGGNIGKNTDTPNENAVNDYSRCFTGLYEYVDYFVINVSCPNISNLAKLQDQESLEKILNEVAHIRSKHSLYKPVFLKISPDLNYKQIDETIEIVNKTGIDGLVVSNTTVSREGLKTSEHNLQKIGSGGLSGLPIKERSTEMIRYIHEKTSGKLPIIGVGGILTVKDALEKIDAGATLLQIYTGFIYSGPALVKKINKALAKQTG